MLDVLLMLRDRVPLADCGAVLANSSEASPILDNLNPQDDVNLFAYRSCAVVPISGRNRGI